MYQLINLLNQYKALRLAALTSSMMLVISLVGLVIDDRLLLGENVWLKPMKFGVSIPIFCLTTAWLLSVFPYSERIKKRLDTLLGWSLVLEVPLVMVQAVRGVRSHFNDETIFDGTIFGIMGLLIGINSIALIWMMATAFRRRLLTDKSTQLSIQFGFAAMLISLIAGQLMIKNMAHAVGVPDGGEGLPITHWSTKGGDWRAVHFLGMHGLQILPLLIFFLKNTIQERPLKAVAWISGVAYLGIIIYIFWRTALGFPLISA